MGNINLKNERSPFKLERSEIAKIDSMIREGKNLEETAGLILEGTYKSVDIFNKDSIDRFLDFVIARVRTGSYHIVSLAFPTRRMSDKDMEERIIKLINVYLCPEIILPMLKYFALNVKDSDRNLHLAYLINSEDIIGAVYKAFLLFKKDIFITDPFKRCLNVKRIQQLPSTTNNSASSPLDAACRFKYILEFIALKQNVEHIYTPDQIRLSQD